jgi:S1-C subfamily serine protease
MRKLNIFLIIVIASVIALAVQILFGNFLSARLATLPALRNLNLFNPRAPIVVTNRETVRVSDANDAVETVNAVKSKISLVVYYEGTGESARIVPAGGALNWTSDGFFISSSSTFAIPGKTYAVVLNTGEIFPIKEVYNDTASSLVVLSTDARNLSTIEPVAGNDLRPGEKMLMMLNAMSPNETTFLESYVKSGVSDVSGIGFSSDLVKRQVSIQQVGVLSPGHAAISLNGRLAGMWDGNTVISSDAIRLFATNFFRDNKQIIRPSYGFTYRQLSATEARALQLQVGAQIAAVLPNVPAVTPNSPAAVAGLKAGDIITAVNGQVVNEKTLLESLLAAVVPGEVVTMAVTRNGQLTTVIITPKILE